MGLLLTIGCYLVAFSPSFVLFCRFVAPDALRIILFVLGAFFWLVSLLISSLIWLSITSFWSDGLVLSIGVSVLLQESSKVFYFWLLKKAQSGLNKITKPGATSVAPGVSDLHNARHMLALVCGLGVGVIASLFLSMNVFAELSGPGSIGLPEALKKQSSNVNPGGSFLPFYYAVSACLLTLLHVTWTIMIWDSCHRIKKSTSWFLPAAVALVSHYVVSTTSLLSASGQQKWVLGVQFTILVGCFVYCHVIMNGTFQTFFVACKSAIIDWTTLAYLQKRLSRGGQYVVDEVSPSNVVPPNSL